MKDPQQILVNDHIGDLRREAESLRTERQLKHLTRQGHGARVRLGNWLIGVGNAVAGSAGDRQGDAAGHAT